MSQSRTDRRRPLLKGGGNAVNYHGGFGRWALLVCKDPRTLNKMLDGLFRELRQ